MLNRPMTRRGFSGVCTSAAPCHAALIAMPAPVRSPSESCPGFFRTVSTCGPAILKVAHFLDSQISGEVIHRWDGALGIASGWFARGLRDFSGPPEGAE